MLSQIQVPDIVERIEMPEFITIGDIPDKIIFVMPKPEDIPIIIHLEPIECGCVQLVPTNENQKDHNKK